MKERLNYLISHRTLPKEEAKEVLLKMGRGDYNEVEMAAFLTVYMMRQITVEELEGFREAMLELCLSLDLSEYDPVDLVGTGGDGKNTFNISTLSAFVVAGAGQLVAKHGNNGVSSLCGSSNLLLELGYNFSNDPERLKRDLDRAGITFLHAPLFHPAMKRIAPVRAGLRVKTFFNMLGPLTNPARVKKIVNGLFSLELMRNYNYLYQKSECDYAVLHGLDGYDEISLTGEVKIQGRSKGDYFETLLAPSDFGFPIVDPTTIGGGKDIKESAKIFLSILDGEGSESQENVVIANAGVTLQIAKNISLAEGLSEAKESLKSGRARERLQRVLAD